MKSLYRQVHGDQWLDTWGGRDSDNAVRGRVELMAGRDPQGRALYILNLECSVGDGEFPHFERSTYEVLTGRKEEAIERAVAEANELARLVTQAVRAGQQGELPAADLYDTFDATGRALLRAAANGRPQEDDLPF